MKRNCAASRTRPPRELVVFTVHNWACSPIWPRRGFGGEASWARSATRAALMRTKRRPQPAPATGVRTSSWPARILVDHGCTTYTCLKSPFSEQPVQLPSSYSGPAPAGAVGRGNGRDGFFPLPAATALLRLTWRAAYRSNWPCSRFHGRAELRMTYSAQKRRPRERSLPSRSQISCRRETRSDRGPSKARARHGACRERSAASE